MILAGALADEEAVERFYIEAQAVGNLRHTNIVRVHEVGQYQGHHFFSMDYIEGSNLAEVAGDHPIGSREAADYVRTIADAIHCAHVAGIIHRDLKPSNILTDASAQPLITDFGMAKRIDDDSGITRTGRILGTPSYMPPEQIDSKEEAIENIKKTDKKAFKHLCRTVREDGAYIEAGENDNLIISKLEENPKAFGVFGYSFLDQNKDKLQGSIVEGSTPTFENISSGKYPVSRSLYFYIKNAQVGKIPGISEYIAEFTSEKSFGTDGYLQEKGLIPSPDVERAKVRTNALGLSLEWLADFN